MLSFELIEIQIAKCTTLQLSEIRLSCCFDVFCRAELESSERMHVRVCVQRSRSVREIALILFSLYAPVRVTHKPLKTRTPTKFVKASNSCTVAAIHRYGICIDVIIITAIV